MNCKCGALATLEFNGEPKCMSCFRADMRKLEEREHHLPSTRIDSDERKD